MITPKGRLIALSSVAVLLFAACTSGGASPSAEAPTTAPTEAASAPADSPAAGPIEVGYLPKDVVNQYFAAAKTGIDKAVTELGGAPVTTVGPNTPDAPLQIPFITDLTTKGVDAIIFSADDPDAVVPALKEAMAAGIKVVAFDASPAVGAYDVFVNQVDFSGVGVNLAEWACELAPDCAGDIAILSAKATSPNQNSWIELMKTTLTTDPKYAKLNLVDTVYGNDEATESTTQANALLAKYPDLKVIVAPTTVGILAAAQVVSGQNKQDSVKVTGLGLPGEMTPYVKDGTSPAFGLWNVIDLGYLAYYVADALVKGTITGAEGDQFTVPSLNGGQPYTIGKDGVVILGPAFRFDANNIDEHQWP